MRSWIRVALILVGSSTIIGSFCIALFATQLFKKGRVDPSMSPSLLSQIPTISQTPTISAVPSISPSGAPSTDPSLFALTLDVASDAAYDSPILVTFNNPTPSERNWMGIFEESDESLWFLYLWAGMCGDQESYNDDADLCPAKSSGSITFSGDYTDAQSSYNKWPLEPGNYKICGFRDDETGRPYYGDTHVCESFTVTVPVHPAAPSAFPSISSAPSVASFPSAFPSISSAPSMILTQEPSIAPTMILALSSGECNSGNKCGKCEGNCETNEDCADGLICYQRDANEPVFGCAGEGGDGDVSGNNICVPMSMTLVVASQVEYDSPILVTFNNPTPSEGNWIGIFEEFNESLIAVALWAGMCGDQESYYADDPCPAKSSGSITFSRDNADDINYYEVWPLAPGNYKVCAFHDENGSPYYDDPNVCESFTITAPVPSLSPSSVPTTVPTNENELTLDVATETAYDTPISVTFENPTLTEGNWIGIYHESDESLTENSLWAGMCGDQDSWYYDECPSKSSGIITFSGDGPDQSNNEEWPLDPGNYKVCVYGGPYYEDLHVCESFTILDYSR